MRRALLDVNVLLALLDERHAFHGRAMEWLKANADGGWASCPITQNGYLRIVTQPKYQGCRSPQDAIERLSHAASTDKHEFWPDDISLLDRTTARPDRIHGTRQFTDVYLLALAVHHGGRLVTLDSSVPLNAVPQATEDHIAIL